MLILRVFRIQRESGSEYLTCFMDEWDLGSFNHSLNSYLRVATMCKTVDNIVNMVLAFLEFTDESDVIGFKYVGEHSR